MLGKGLLSGVCLALVALVAAIVLGALYSQGRGDLPAHDIQPVDFSHALHAGKLEIACLYCHRHAEASPVASVPTVHLCASCHRSVRTATPETEKLMLFWDQNRPIPWIRLQRLPDHVYFSHEMHLSAGLRCADCHGNVARTRYTPRAATYEMGWCLSCHQQRGASRDCWTCHK